MWWRIQVNCYFSVFLLEIEESHEDLEPSAYGTGCSEILSRLQDSASKKKKCINKQNMRLSTNE